MNRSNGIRQTLVRSGKLRRDYDLALRMLKPTKAELEHGLELHKACVVFDTYGFMPRAAMDGKVIAEAINNHASYLELQDLREDMSMSRMVFHERERKEFEEAWRASGVTCVFQNASYSCHIVKKVIKRLSRFTYTTDMMRDFLRKASTPDDIVQAKKDGIRAIYFTGNGVPLPQEWVSVE